MKHTLGKMVILLFLFTASLLHAEDFTYSFHISKKTPYVKEPVLLTLDLNQTNHDIVLLFKFQIKESPDFSFQPLDIKESDTYHDTKIHYSYLIYPLKAGKVTLEFTLVKKVTNDESIAYSYSGGRDNVKTLVTKNTEISLPPLTLHVKPLPKGTELVGNFTLTHRFGKHEAKAYEPIPFQIEIAGEGFPPILENILPEDLNVTHFTEKPIVKSSLNHKGSSSKVIYPLALSYNKNFELPQITLHAFDPAKEKKYTLTVPAQHFTIQQEKKQNLLDKEDRPKPFSTDWSWLTNLLGYLFAFAAGYASAKVIKWNKRETATAKSLLFSKIENCSDPRALLQLLIATEHKKFASEIEALEKHLYKDGKISFRKIKQSALEKAS